jgi:hypothetical protein
MSPSTQHGNAPAIAAHRAIAGPTRRVTATLGTRTRARAAFNADARKNLRK